MSIFTLKHFDVLDFVKKSKELGASEQLAEYQARQFEQVIEIAIASAREDFHAKELVSKTDLVVALRELELRLVKWVMATGIATVIALGGILKFMLH